MDWLAEALGSLSEERKQCQNKKIILKKNYLIEISSLGNIGGLYIQVKFSCYLLHKQCCLLSTTAMNYHSWRSYQNFNIWKKLATRLPLTLNSWEKYWIFQHLEHNYKPYSGYEDLLLYLFGWDDGNMNWKSTAHVPSCSWWCWRLFSS